MRKLSWMGVVGVVLGVLGLVTVANANIAAAQQQGSQQVGCALQNGRTLVNEGRHRVYEFTCRGQPVVVVCDVNRCRAA